MKKYEQHLTRDPKLGFNVSVNALRELLRDVGIHVVGKWINAEKRRYYRVMAGVDLLGDVLLEREWGSLDTKQSNKMVEVFTDKEIELLQDKISQIAKTRNQHNYKQIYGIMDKF